MNEQKKIDLSAYPPCAFLRYLVVLPRSSFMGLLLVQSESPSPTAIVY